MGHRRDAVEALRNYAHDLESTIDDGGVPRVGRSRQDDDRREALPLGAPHSRALVIVALVVLAGVAGVLALATGSTTDSETAAGEERLIPIASAAGTDAVRALAAIGDAEGAATVARALASDAADDPTVTALIDQIAVVAATVAAGADAEQASITLAMLIEDLEAATRPPGLDPDRAPPGQGGTPPGQDETFTPPGQDETFTPPGQDEDRTPPGQDEDRTPPGQDRKGGG